MQSMRYQQQVIGYHGCDRSVRDRILLGKEKLRLSSNDYDWLGKGIYFWEQGPERAEDWAAQQHRRGLIAEPSVLGAHPDRREEPGLHPRLLSARVRRGQW